MNPLGYTNTLHWDVDCYSTCADVLASVSIAKTKDFLIEFWFLSCWIFSFPFAGRASFSLTEPQNPSLVYKCKNKRRGLIGACDSML